MLTYLMNLKIVFSTYVEVILSGVVAVSMFSGILHVCGGDPHCCH